MKHRNLIATLTVGLLVISACGGGDSGASSTTTTGGATTTTGPASGDGVHSAETDLGTILVDPDGFTLYVFTADVEGESTCYDSCANNWPAVSADTVISTDLDASPFGSAPRTDGSDQLTINGQPLYRFAPDSNPGDTNGQGVGGVWFVVDSSGAMVGNPEANGAGASTSTEDDGRDY